MGHTNTITVSISKGGTMQNVPGLMEVTTNLLSLPPPPSWASSFMSIWCKNSHAGLWGLVHKKHTSSACRSAYVASMLENHQFISCKLKTQNYLNLD